MMITKRRALQNNTRKPFLKETTLKPDTRGWVYTEGLPVHRSKQIKIF